VLGSRPKFMETNLAQYDCGPVRLHGDPDALYDRHLIFDNVVDPAQANSREHYAAFARAIRDVLSQRWIRTEATYAARNPKQVYYLSMEFLIGRSLANNVLNLQLWNATQELCRQNGLDWDSIRLEEPEAGLGNGGLGRLAACYLESLATLQMPAMGHGLRYEFGIFKQLIENDEQLEKPDPWLRYPDPWEVARPDEKIEVKLNCSFEVKAGSLEPIFGRPSTLVGIPHDRPVVGYGGKTINTLRLWAASAAHAFNFQQFSHGDFVGAVAETLTAESLTRVLYPDDSTSHGQGLRFLQEYFLAACSVGDLIRRFRRRNNDWSALPDKVAIQLNDTHPSMAVTELMRILLDDAKLGWDEAWRLTIRSLAYTNHTLLPEALEKWPVRWFETIIPRHLEIIYEINRRFLAEVQAKYPGDVARLEKMSLIEEDQQKKVRMANLCILGSHSVNGVAAIHSELVKSRLVPEFAEMYPERFNNKTNGVTPRRWIALANPPLARFVTDTIGDGWITNLGELARLRPLASDHEFQTKVQAAARSTKLSLVDWLKKFYDVRVNPDTIFDTQIKRIHEYKRQLLNALHIVMLCQRLRDNPALDEPPRTFFFAGKAAPAYSLAKNIIRFINHLGSVIAADPALRDRIQVVFLPDYSVSLAQRLIPASDVSEQISTAGFEASGTSNMKFMMNGALTIGTRDGATIEMAAEAGEENFFLFGLTADQVNASRSWYDPHWHYDNDPAIRRVLDYIFGREFTPDQTDAFAPIRNAIFGGDRFMHLADFHDYAATQQRLGRVYRDPPEWSRRVILNIAASGKFSSDRAVQEYASEIWKTEPCPVVGS
jgi:starch phosphorylase